MRAKSLMMALLGFAVAGGSVMAANQFLADRSQAGVARQEADLVKVVVAARDIGFGQVIESTSVATQAWPRSALPLGAVTSLSDVIAAIGGEPRRARRSIAQGELLLKSKISGFGEKVTIVQSLSANSRAVAIKVDAVSGVAGFVTPGDKVDIVLTQGGRGELRAVTILQNIRVIGVDQASDEMKDDPGIARTITVEVTPDESQRLALAQQAGQLSLTLRTANNVVDEPLEMIRLGDLMREKSPVPEKARQPTIRVRRANDVQDVEIGG